LLLALRPLFTDYLALSWLCLLYCFASLSFSSYWLTP
jgi:hypothetical protein